MSKPKISFKVEFLHKEKDIVYNISNGDKGVIICHRCYVYHTRTGEYFPLPQYYVCWGERYEWEDEEVLTIEKMVL